jgi:tRNA(adenine34) deaminase
MDMLKQHAIFMNLAVELAHQAADKGEVPVGAVIVRDSQVIGTGHNLSIVNNDATAHAEIVAMRNASKKIRNYRLIGCDLYVTIEPCTMCVGAMVHARINRIIFGAKEPRAGALQSQFQLLDDGRFNHSIDVIGGILADECSEIMSKFFREKRRKN